MLYAGYKKFTQVSRISLTVTTLSTDGDAKRADKIIEKLLLRIAFKAFGNGRLKDHSSSASKYLFLGKESFYCRA